MTHPITLAITSCGRMDLLEKTLKSFYKFNTYPIFKTIIIDDSCGGFDTERISACIPNSYEFILNTENIGQIRSIDKLYSSITTPYVFHCEDDWEFYKEGFIEESLAILEHHKQIITVWLRAHNDTNTHPISQSESVEGFDNKLMQRKYRGAWSGFTFNPGLKRLTDYQLLAPYAEKPIIIGKKNQRIASEIDLSIYYDRLGFRAAITTHPEGYVKHTGWGDHIPQEWESSVFARAYIKLRNLIKKHVLYRN
ncbi:glycosyltransferase family A protein [Methylophilus sp. DW102]|uniref:glycosyltransferase family A protein n=1 Tax=Methylophilus sp. DW102 TaxID=3095607 RepID=UPI00308BB0A6|nr:glycosyltransferase [Methylophilus sp. DW102]